MKKELYNGKRLKVARIYRGKTIEQVSKETNINKKYNIFKGKAYICSGYFITVLNIQEA